ncbi:LysR family transcriptional regulator [Caulobacter sp. 17J65-9]|uniref:LysR family transcriptional regulator n=1 Tax=Caulobacter sp. 17J65-9 TaxID=2709382 RepID=UPI0013CD3CF6|nr:LysR family transcriptional regulator [Caulobacter sp. 17J65-9]NEX92798.1 LysR family transcriptional regulator [Caulobacter sp. 17J65-9]
MNIAAFDLNLLRVFDALMRERSVTRAGERVGLSQPAVSAALGRLRAALQDQLFVRRGTEMVPTPRAEALAEPVRAALAQLETALGGDDRFDPAASTRTYTLMGADFFSTLVLPRLFERVRAEAPGVRLRLVDSARGEVDRLLQEDAIDLALERPLSTPSWISSERLFLSPFAVIAARSENVGARPGEAFPLDGFCALPQAIRSIDGSMSGLVDQALAEAGRTREVVLALPHFQSVALAVARGGLIACVPRQFADAVATELGLSVYLPPISVPVPEIKMYWRKRHDRNPAHAWLRARVLDVVADL